MLLINIRRCLMFVLSVIFSLCPTCKWKCNKQESLTSWMSSPINLAMCLTINLFCHTAGRVQMGGSSRSSSSSQVSVKWSKRQWISFSHLSNHSFLVSYPFCENSTGYVCQLLPLNVHKGSLALDAVFIIYKKVPDFTCFFLWREEVFWLSLACLSLPCLPQCG